MFPLAGVWISRYTSFITWIMLSTLVRWLGAHQCKISWKLRLNTSNTDLQTMMQNINKFAARQTRPVLTNTRSSRSHMLFKIGVLKNLAKLHGNTCWSRFSNRHGTLWKKRLRHSSFSINFAKCLRITLPEDCFWVSQYVPKAFKTKCDKNESNDILITYLYILMASTYMSMNIINSSNNISM